MINLKYSLLPAALACLIGATAASAETTFTTVTTRTTTTAPITVTGYSYGAIGMRRAEDIAVSEEPGRIEGARLVRAMDGRPVYVFNIVNNRGVFTVSVDGTNGRVVDDVEQGVRYHRANFWDRLFAPTNID